MNFLVQFGVGLIFQSIEGAQARAQQQQLTQQNAQFAAQLQEQMDETAQQGSLSMGDPFAPDPGQQGALATADPFAPGLAFNDMPAFPEQAATNMQDMQAQHATQMQTLSDQFLQASTDLKASFLSQNHLAVKQAAPTPDEPDPSPQVAVDEEGKPIVEPGPEQPVHQEAREQYESQQQQTITHQHTQQTQQFVGEEKQNVQQFLQDNKPDLTNPAVQQQLHNMLSQSQKKAWNLQTDQERELLKHDAYSPDMETNVDNYVNTKRSMQQQQNQQEEESPDAGALYQHQQDMAAFLQQKKDELQDSQQQNSFLTGPPQFNGASSGAPVDVARVLPPYLSSALYGMGIYEV